MGFVLSILYLLTCYLTPTTIFGGLAVYRIELILALALFVISLPSLVGAIVWKTTQTIALAGLAFATFMSIVISGHWFGGGMTAFLAFIPNAFAYFLVCLHCNSKLKLKIVVFMMMFVCFFVIAQGAVEMRHGLPTNRNGQNASNVDDSYFFGMDNNAGQWFYRLRGMGEINDPNDFAQLIVCVLPLIFVFWRRKKIVRNFVFVLVPVCVLVWGAYLTHSRGAMLALLAVIIMAVRRRIGTVPALILAGALFAGAMALHFTGGRQISASAGEDRTELWGEGLQLLKSHPFFGVGFGEMPDYVGHTAHNSIVVCAAELGLFGLYFWSLFLLPTVRDALAIGSVQKVAGGVAIRSESGSEIEPETETHFFPSTEIAATETEEIKRLGRLLVLSLTGFLVAGWFLSRAYVMTLFLLGGLVEVIFEMGLKQGMISPRLPFGRVLRYSGVMMFGLVMLMYILLRIVNITH